MGKETMPVSQEVEVRTADHPVEIVQVPAGPPMTLFGDRSPAEVVSSATEVARSLAAVIDDRNLYNTIRGRKHVLVEGWTLLGTMLGVFPVVEWTRQTEDGWEARVSARTLTGAEVGSAEAMCSRKEARWRSADDYAVRSMAQTRATSKALRLPLGFVMTLAGYDATPEEEMPVQHQVIDQPRTVDAISEETLMELLTLLPKAEFHDPERWNLEAVLGTASRVFGHKIEKIADLTQAEAERIIEGAKVAVNEMEAEHGEETENGE